MTDRYQEAGAYPETDLLVGPDGASAACPYCDNVIGLHRAHECGNCGATFEVTVQWRPA